MVLQHNEINLLGFANFSEEDPYRDDNSERVVNTCFWCSSVVLLGFVITMNFGGTKLQNCKISTVKNAIKQQQQKKEANQRNLS